MTKLPVNFPFSYRVYENELMFVCVGNYEEEKCHHGDSVDCFMTTKTPAAAFANLSVAS